MPNSIRSVNLYEKNDMRQLISFNRKKGVFRVSFYAIIPHCHFQPSYNFNGLSAENSVLQLKTGAFPH
jgi:hypothetical protein